LSTEIFDLAYIDSIVKTHLSGEELSGQRLSDLISIALLCQTGM